MLAKASRDPQQYSFHQILPVLEPPVHRRRIRTRRPRHRSHGQRPRSAPPPQTLRCFQDALLEIWIRMPRHDSSRPPQYYHSKNMLTL
jgi:hypothetical protein